MEFLMKRVAVLPFPGMDNCFVCVSGKLRRKEMQGEKWYSGHKEHKKSYSDYEDRTEACISFVYKGNEKAAEWDGEYGPITVWTKCDKDYKEEYEEAREHWIFPYAYGQGNWSQLAVNEADLPTKFNQGDYEGIFNELKHWVD